MALRDNSFDFMRFLAAVSVLVGHHKALNGMREPALPIFRDTIGGVATCVFFAISGFLIFQSLERTAKWNEFVAARCARLLPNLTFALIITSLVMLLWYRNFDHIPEHIGYVKNNLLMFFRGVQFTIPGILEGRPLAGPNGSLWTLPYEVWLYVALFTVFLLKERFRVFGVATAFVFSGCLWLLAIPGENVLLMGMNFNAVALGKLSSYFFAGALIASFWQILSLRLYIVTAVAFLGAGLSVFVFPASNPALALTFSFIVIAACTKPWAASFGKFGDPSYGIYILAFPVQQLCILSIDGFYNSMIAAMAITIAIAYFTWHTFEKKCVFHRQSLARMFALPFRSQG